MRGFSLRLDHSGIGEILKSREMGEVVGDAGEDIRSRVAAAVPAGIDVTVQRYVTDRQAASVAIEHPRGIALQARHGVLTRAATSIGADFSPPKRGLR